MILNSIFATLEKTDGQAPECTRACKVTEGMSAGHWFSINLRGEKPPAASALAVILQQDRDPITAGLICTHPVGRVASGTSRTRLSGLSVQFQQAIGLISGPCRPHYSDTIFGNRHALGQALSA